jgi:XRE family transcriptional regulator, aerobic/anaerobic benzoate catabolism transcriptional regulator
MKRVVAQGDMRPMAASREAMQDLKGILDSRAAFYGKADFRLDTSSGTLAEVVKALAGLLKA